MNPRLMHSNPQAFRSTSINRATSQCLYNEIEYLEVSHGMLFPSTIHHSICNSEIVHVFLKIILSREDCVSEIALFAVPLIKAAIREHLHSIIDDKRHDIISQTFLEHDQPTYTTVSILERMDGFKAYMESDNVIQCFLLYCIVCFQKCTHFCRYSFRRGSFPATNLIGQTLIATHCKPVSPRVAGTVFQRTVKFLDKTLRESIFCSIQYHIDALVMVGSLHDVVYIQGSCRKADGVCLEHITSLIVGQAASFDMV